MANLDLGSILLSVLLGPTCMKMHVQAAESSLHETGYEWEWPGVPMYKGQLESADLEAALCQPCTQLLPSTHTPPRTLGKEGAWHKWENLTRGVDS